MLEDGRQEDVRQQFTEKERKQWRRMGRAAVSLEQISQSIVNSADWLRKGYVNASSSKHQGLDYHRRNVEESMKSLRKAYKELQTAFQKTQE